MIDQQAGGGLVAPAHPAAQLVKLGQAEPFGVLDHHDGRVRRVHADLDHGGRHQHVDLPGPEGGRDPLLLLAGHPPVQQADPDPAQHGGQEMKPLFGRGEVGDVAFLHQRADPVGALALGHGPAQPGDHVFQPFGGNDARDRRDAPRRLFIQARHIQIAIDRQRQRPGDGRGAHHQRVGRAALLRQAAPVGHAEAVLLVDHHQRQIVERHAVLEQGMGAADHRRLAARDPRLQRSPGRALVAPGQRDDFDSGRFEKRADHRCVLAREDLGRRHDGGLRARLGAARGGQRRHERLARADIAVQQAHHALGRGHVRAHRLEGAGLRAGGGEGRMGQHLLHPVSIAGDRAALARLAAGAGELQRELVGEQLVESQALTVPAVFRIEIHAAGRGVRRFQRLGEARPVLSGQKPRLDPFGQIGRLARGRLRCLAHHRRRQARGQRIDRLQQVGLGNLAGRGDQVGMDHLQLGPEPLHLARHHAGFALGQDPPQVIAPAVKEDQGEKPALVAQPHLVGLFHRGRGLMLLDRAFQRHDAVAGRVRDPHPAGPVDQTDRRCEGQVLHPRPAAHLLDQRGDLRPHAGQRRQIGEQGKEDVRAHPRTMAGEGDSGKGAVSVRPWVQPKLCRFRLRRESGAPRC